MEVRGESVYEEIEKIANNGIEIIDAYILAAQKLKKDWEKFYMGKENIKLTISVLISGNKENVTRCLQSLNHLMQEVPSELILTDTGCSPEVRDLIENYTDHILILHGLGMFSLPYPDNYVVYKRPLDTHHIVLTTKSFQ